MCVLWNEFFLFQASKKNNAGVITTYKTHIQHIHISITHLAILWKNALIGLQNTKIFTFDFFFF